MIKIVRFLLGIVALVLPVLASAQAPVAPSSLGPYYTPNWYLGYTPTPQQWQFLLSNKVDANTVSSILNSSTTWPTPGQIVISTGNNTPVGNTLTALLDTLGGSAQGSVLIRGATGWIPSPVGNIGQFLKSNGAGASASWGLPSGSGTVNAGLSNQLAYYGSAGAAVSGLATVNNGVLVTSSSGVPSISTTLPSGLAISLSNGTGLPISTGLTGAGTGVLAALASPVTGSGGPVLATSPTLVTPALGTPSALVLTNATGLPPTGLTNNTITVNGVACSLASPATCTISASAGTITAGTTTVAGGISGDLLFNNSGTLGNEAISSLSIAASQITGTVTAAQMPASTGDVTNPAGSTVNTLATVNSSPGSVGSSTTIPVLTTNGKGLVTAQTTAAVVAPAGTLTGTTLASGVTGSSLTSLGTLTRLTTGNLTVNYAYPLTNVTLYGTGPTSTVGTLMQGIAASAGTPETMLALGLDSSVAGYKVVEYNSVIQRPGSGATWNYNYTNQIMPGATGAGFGIEGDHSNSSGTAAVGGGIILNGGGNLRNGIAFDATGAAQSTTAGEFPNFTGYISGTIMTVVAMGSGSPAIVPTAGGALGQVLNCNASLSADCSTAGGIVTGTYVMAQTGGTTGGAGTYTVNASQTLGSSGSPVHMWSYGSGWDASYADGSSQTCGFCSTSQATAAVRIGGNHIYGLQVLANVITPGGYAISTPGFSVDPTGIVTAQTFSGALTGHASLDLPLAGGTVTGGTTFSGSGTGLAVTNNATIGGTLGVTGAATFSGGLTGALTGHASLDLPLAGGTVTGGTTFSGSGTGLAVTNNATIGGTLGVTGAATFSGGLTGALTGHASLDFPLTGGSTITGNVLTTQTVFANGFSIYGGAYGVSCTGTPTSSFQSVNGIVIHC